MPLTRHGSLTKGAVAVTVTDAAGHAGTANVSVPIQDPLTYSAAVTAGQGVTVTHLSTDPPNVFTVQA